ncbi:BEL1-like homeodomain protein 9 [Hibiscus syriacus]|uniref:BEL1-like homeodomain protein 9 n=1 Tax=Hibiscus syriacus TaxID=106335 RepID=A0A6A3BDS8_HIBSY|nr:BEL1-like homeodomain protein 9 [Hibiscus syriacus]
MAEGFEPYHVPQQSRRDKLRVVAQNHPAWVESTAVALSGCSGFLPLYDPSLLSSDLLTATAGGSHGFHHHQTGKNSPICVVKEEGMNFMGFVGGIVNGSSSSSSTSYHPYLNSASSLPLNPSTIQDMNNNNNPFLYAPQSLENLRDFNQSSYNNSTEVVVYKPEASATGQGLSLSLSSHNTHQNNLSMALNLQRYDSAIYSDKVTPTGYVASTSNEVSRSSVPLGPFTGYASILKGSKFLWPAQQLLEELCDVGTGSYVEKITPDSSMMELNPRLVPPVKACLFLYLSPNTHQNNLSMALNLQSSVPLGPFTGYASILKGSKFLWPAQQLLEELCDVGTGSYVEKITPDSSMMESPSQNLSATAIIDDSENSGKKSRLFSLLDEAFRRYKQYYQQMQAVVASFECVAGLSNAAPYADLALKALSKHFSFLKTAITDQLQFTNNAHGQISPGKDEGLRSGSSNRSNYNRSVHNSGFPEHQPAWRPQRGLPERAVTVLRAWLFEHFLHPYPTDTDKLMLAKQTGLSRSQVSNWFINARVRLWKPMVEEIHVLETKQAQKASQKDRNLNKSSDHLSSANTLGSEHPATSSQRAQDTPLKQMRSELTDIPMGSEPLNLPYNSLSSHPQVGVGVSMAGGSTSGVSLTLGLHQSNGIGLPEPFTINAAQRFGIGVEVNNEGYVIGGYEAQNRHFGRDVIGGQLLHDFVG